MLPHYRLHVSVVETNKVPTAPVRGAGYPEGCFAMERVLDAIARDRGLDRVEVRRRNLVPASAIPYSTPMEARSTSAIVYESGDFPAWLWRAAMRPVFRCVARMRWPTVAFSASASR